MVNAKGDSLCNQSDAPCFNYGFIVSNGVDDDEGTAMCDSGFSFPDGMTMKKIYCERVIDKTGRMIAQWTELDGECERKFQTVNQSKLSFVILFASGNLI